MDKWADYAIYAVRYNTEHTHIAMVRMHADNGDAFSPETVEWTRQNVVAAIKRGTSFVTVFFRDGQWKMGRPVRIIEIKGVEYIKTLKDNTAADNLDELPEY